MLIHSIWESVAFDPTTGTSIVQGRICHTDDPYDFCEGFARNSVHFPPHQWVERNTNLYISFGSHLFPEGDSKQTNFRISAQRFGVFVTLHDVSRLKKTAGKVACGVDGSRGDVAARNWRFQRSNMVNN
jgi:hypothetical protein